MTGAFRQLEPELPDVGGHCALAVRPQALPTGGRRSTFVAAGRARLTRGKRGLVQHWVRERGVLVEERLTLTVEEAAGLLGISRNLAYELVAKNELPSLRLGRRVLIPRQALDRLLNVGSAEQINVGARP